MLVLKRLIKVCQWLPVIWRDEDWDYGFLLDLMAYKLGRMEKVIGSHKSPAAHWQNRKAELVQAQLLIANIKEDPEDEWTVYYDTHTIDFSTEESLKASEASQRREELNWLRLWKYLDQNMRKWWD